jgi:hypothetical protein
LVRAVGEDEIADTGCRGACEPNRNRRGRSRSALAHAEQNREGRRKDKHDPEQEAAA